MMLTLVGKHATTTLKNTLASQAVKGEQDKDVRSSCLLLNRHWPERVHLYTHALAKIHLSCHEHRRKLPSIVCGAGAMVHCAVCAGRRFWMMCAEGVLWCALYLHICNPVPIHSFDGF